MLNTAPSLTDRQEGSEKWRIIKERGRKRQKMKKSKQSSRLKPCLTRLLMYIYVLILGLQSFCSYAVSLDPTRDLSCLMVNLLKHRLKRWSTCSVLSSTENFLVCIWLHITSWILISCNLCLTYVRMLLCALCVKNTHTHWLYNPESGSAVKCFIYWALMR